MALVAFVRRRGVLRRLSLFPRRWGCARALNRGYTLVELLLVSVLGTLIVLAVINVIESHVRSRTKLEALMRLQDHWSRVQFLIDADIEEGRRILSGSSGLCSATGTTLLTLEVPGFSQKIRYYLAGSGNELRRCGPLIGVNGELQDVAFDSLVVRGVSDFFVDLSDAERPIYRFTLSDSSGVTYTNGREPTGDTFRSRVIN